MYSKVIIKTLVALVCVVSYVGTTSNAEPFLQLDILAGDTWYDDITESITTSQSSFTLRALINTAKTDDYALVLDNTYYISAAVQPSLLETFPSPDFGSFVFGGDTIQVTEDMKYGTPPVDGGYPDIPTHGVYPTYYAEFSFPADTTQTTYRYNTEDYPGGIVPNPDLTDKSFLYKDFEVDVSAYTADSLHFDLYAVGLNKNGKKIVTYKAPFSHDAIGDAQYVPTPSAFILGSLGLGIAQLRLGRRKQARQL